MSDSNINQQIPEQKPVNINISFNISRKQVTQNVNPKCNPSQRADVQNQAKKEPNPDHSLTNIRKKTNPIRASRTPELAQTDRQDYLSKEVSYLRQTEELKRKKRRKRSSVDYSNENNIYGNLAVYPSQMEKTLPTHKRGHTTAFIKKSTAVKSKKPTTNYIGDFTSARTSKNHYSGNADSVKTEGKLLQKNLKAMISKLLKEEVSKKSLPVPSSSKSKHNISASLTQRKRSTKKKANKAQSLKEKSLKSERINRGEANEALTIFKGNDLFDKLGNLKSVENSVLVTEAEAKEDDLEMNKKNRKTIIIKTDHSIECIDQIHSFESKKYKDEFFDVTGSSPINAQQNAVKKTQNLIETYIKLLNQEQGSHIDQLHESDHQGANILQNADISKVQDLLRSDYGLQNAMQCKQQKYFVQENRQIQGQDLQEVHLQQSTEKQREGITSAQLLMPEQKNNSKSLRQEIECFQMIESSKSKVIEEEKSQQQVLKNVKDQSLSQSNTKVRMEKEGGDEVHHFRPFMSSEMGRDSISNLDSIERQQLNAIKKQEVEKWGYLLQYIRSNMNKDTVNTQEILSEVYSYLEKAKVDLQKEPHIPKAGEKSDIQEFTVKYSDQQQQSSSAEYSKLEQSRRVFEGKQIEAEGSSDLDQVLSFKQEYEDDEENDRNLKFMSLETIQGALKSRFNNLTVKKQNEIRKLEQSLESGKLSAEEFEIEKEKIEKWIKQETNEILKAKKNIWKGYNDAKGILDKSVNSKYFEEYESSASKKMMKCLSESYLNRKPLDYKKFIEDAKREDKQQEEESSISSSEQGASEGEYAQNHFENSEALANTPQNQLSDGFENKELRSEEDLQKINQKLNRLKKEHLNIVEIGKNTKINDFDSQNPLSPSSINFEEIEKEIVSDDDQNSFEDGALDLPEHSNTDQNEFENSGDAFQGYSRDETDEIKGSGCHQNSQQSSGTEATDLSRKMQKLKYMTEQDKEDVFEFLFLDLCIELYQEPCHENQLMKSINRYIEKQEEQKKKKKGVKTNINVVKDYLKRFCGYIVRTNKSALENLNVPMGPTAVEMLRYMHENDDIDEEPRDDDENVVTLIVPIQAFDTFERSLMPTLEFETFYEDEQKQTERVNFLKNILHVHNKALFDALNEFLDQQRPFGIWGKPFPWKKPTSFSHQFNEEQLQVHLPIFQDKLKKSAEKVVQTCSYVCGILVDKEESLVGNARISEGYVEQIRQDRVARMLANDMLQNEERWVFYDDEETEVLVEAGQWIFRNLVNECIQREKPRPNLQFSVRMVKSVERDRESSFNCQQY